MDDTPEQAKLRERLAALAATLADTMRTAASPEHPAEDRAGLVRHARFLLGAVEDYVGLLPGVSIANLDGVRAQLNQLGDALGMSRDDDKPKLRDRPELKGGRGRLGRPTKRQQTSLIFLVGGVRR